MKHSGREQNPASRQSSGPPAGALLPSVTLPALGAPAWARAVGFVYPFDRTGRHGGGARSEFEARTDGVRDERLAKASSHSVLGPPSGAVGRDHDTGGKRAKVVEDSGDEGLEKRSCKMESADDRVEGPLFGQAAGVPADVDDPSVAAAG